jgi:hypothetical protein
VGCYVLLRDCFILLLPCHLGALLWPLQLRQQVARSTAARYVQFGHNYLYLYVISPFPRAIHGTPNHFHLC